MDKKLNKQQLEAYRARWDTVNKFQAEELRMTTFSKRWQQLNTIIRLAVGLGWQVTQNENELTIVRRRWQKLKGLN